MCKDHFFCASRIGVALVEILPQWSKYGTIYSSISDFYTRFLTSLPQALYRTTQPQRQTVCTFVTCISRPRPHACVYNTAFLSHRAHPEHPSARPVPYLVDVVSQLPRVDKQEGLFLGQHSRREGHRVVQDVAAADVEQPCHLRMLMTAHNRRASTKVGKYDNDRPTSA